MADNQLQRGSTMQSVVKTRTASPHRYRILFHNDDVTTMEFVVMVLEQIFDKPHDEAVRLMLAVHHEGKAVVCTNQTYDMAMTKSHEATRLARSHGYPLRITVEQQ